MKILKRWFAWMGRHRRDWPFIVSSLIACGNTEVAISVILSPIFGLTGSSLGLAAGLWATSELTWWNWFSGWFYRVKLSKISAINEAVALKDEAKDFDFIKFLELRKSDPSLIIEVKKFIKKHVVENFDIDRYHNDTFFKKLLSALIVLGYVLACILIFTLGLLPFWWVFALMLCRFLKWKSAYVALYSGNFIKNYFLAYFYEELGFWLWATMLVVSALVMIFILRWITRCQESVLNDHQ